MSAKEFDIWTAEYLGVTRTKLQKLRYVTDEPEELSVNTFDAHQEHMIKQSICKHHAYGVFDATLYFQKEKHMKFKSEPFGGQKQEPNRTIAA